MRAFVLLVIGLFLFPTFAEMEIVPKGVSSFYEPVPNIESPTYGNFDGIVFKPYCYGKNNRGTNNPLDPSGEIVTTITIDGSSYDVRYKASLIKKKSKSDPDDITYLIDLMGESCGKFCKDNSKICSRPLPHKDSDIANIVNQINLRLDNAFGSSVDNTSGQKFQSEIFNFYRSIFLDSRGAPCDYGSLGAYEFNAFSTAAKDYCKTQGDINPCYEKRMCELSCALGNKFSVSSCVNKCRGKVSISGEPGSECLVRTAKKDKVAKVGYASTNSCDVNNITLNAGSTIKPGSKISVSHFQVNGVKGEPFKYYGFEGPMPDPKNKVVPTAGMAVITSEFPGQDGFCGGFHSPLMIFFDHQRPSFNHISTFLFKDRDKRLTYWPENNHPGYFLAIKKESGSKRWMISSPSQLFGDSNYLDGFEALEKIDSNGDGLINKLDERFSDLVLWKDKNSDSVSQKDEIVSLTSKGIHELNLKDRDESYKFNFGQKATARGRSLIKVSGKDGHKIAFMIDIFFSEFYH